LLDLRDAICVAITRTESNRVVDVRLKRGTGEFDRELFQLAIMGEGLGVRIFWLS
jgi:hypothetical protein